MTANEIVIPQAAAIPLRDGRVCLVTSRRGRRWVVPKGTLEPGRTAAEIALQEAWEEAGLLGVLGPAMGTYQYEKYGGICMVTVFPMSVREVQREWPERAERKRAWLLPEEAVDLIDEPALRELILRAASQEIAPMSPPLSADG
jgi:8-oxo-dGTP pyrophosphatase MutT (NUDIX family)